MPNKKPIKLPLYDRRMIELMNFVKTNRINNISTQGEFLISIKFISEGNLNQVKGGLRSFTLEQFEAAKKVYGVDMNWFFDERHTTMFSVNGRTVPALLQLKQAVARMEVEMNSK